MRAYIQFADTCVIFLLVYAPILRHVPLIVVVSVRFLSHVSLFIRFVALDSF